MLLDPQTTNQVDGNELRAMKSSLKKKIALMLLEVLKRKGLKLMYEQDDPPVIVGNLCAEVKAESVEKLLEGLGYEFVVRRRLQDAPKATSKEIYIKMIYLSGEENFIWVRMDMDTTIKSLALGFLPESAESDKR